MKLHAIRLKWLPSESGHPVMHRKARHHLLVKSMPKRLAVMIKKKMMPPMDTNMMK
jgi:hypothetical protein